MSQREKADQAAVKKLEKLGMNPNEERPVEFFLYFPSEWDAYVVGSQLMNLQFSISVQYANSSDKWLCLATKEVQSTSERLIELGNFLDKLAEGNNGNYDGWGTPVFDYKYGEDPK